MGFLVNKLQNSSLRLHADAGIQGDSIVKGACVETIASIMIAGSHGSQQQGAKQLVGRVP